MGTGCAHRHRPSHCFCTFSADRARRLTARQPLHAPPVNDSPRGRLCLSSGKLPSIATATAALPCGEARTVLGANSKGRNTCLRKSKVGKKVAVWSVCTKTAMPAFPARRGGDPKPEELAIVPSPGSGARAQGLWLGERSRHTDSSRRRSEEPASPATV